MSPTRLERQASRRRWRELRSLINAWDPLGLVGLHGLPDEYECLVGPLMRRLEDGLSTEDIAAFLTREFREHFGCEGPNETSTGDFLANARGWFEREWRGPRV